MPAPRPLWKKAADAAPAAVLAAVPFTVWVTPAQAFFPPWMDIPVPPPAVIVNPLSPPPPVVVVPPVTPPVDVVDPPPVIPPVIPPIIPPIVPPVVVPPTCHCPPTSPPNCVPEPSSVVAGAVGLATVLGYRLRRRRAAGAGE